MLAQRIDARAIAEAKAEPLAAVIGRTVKLKRAGQIHIGLCPFHAESTPSFNVYESHYHCFGCQAHGDIIDWRRSIEGLSFAEAVSYKGSPSEFVRAFAARARAYADDPFEASLNGSVKGAMHRARTAYESAGEVKGTVAATYLASRGLRIHGAPLRFHAHLNDRGANAVRPTLIAAITNHSDILTGIQRVFLTPEGGNWKRDGKSVRMTLGPMADGAVKFGKPGAHIGLAESVEKALACHQLFALPVWGVIGTRYTAVRLPEQCRRLTIFADGDETGMRAANEAAAEWERRGLRVEVERPPDGLKDFDQVTQRMAGLD